MGLSDAIARWAARRAHALVVEVPGWWRTRAVVERAVLTRGWSLALSPADADVLVVCGELGPRMGEAVELVWHQMPGPRVRVDVPEDDDVPARLDEAHAALLETARHRHDARHRPTAADLLGEQGEDTGMDHRHEELDHGGQGVHQGHGDYEEPGGHEGMNHAGHSGHEAMNHAGDGDHEAMNHAGDGGHEGMHHGSHGGHEGMDHGGHGGHGGMEHGGHGGHGDMDMSPGGIALAGGDEDRDGLELDVLDVRLGPLLPCWPAGLVVRCSLQGDVVTEARAELVDGPQRRDPGSVGRARSLDNLVSLLALAGWDDAAADARSVRDAMLGQGGTEAPGAGADRLRTKVCGSRLLRWSLRSVRTLSEADVHQHGLPPDATGDSYDRLLRLLDRSAGASGDQAPLHDRAVNAHHLAHLVTGLDLATARLVIASLDIHELLVGHEHEVAHG